MGKISISKHCIKKRVNWYKQPLSDIQIGWLDPVEGETVPTVEKSIYCYIICIQAPQSISDIYLTRQ